MLKKGKFLLILGVFITVSFTFGLKVVKTKDGKEIELYKGSYAFIVGNGNYKNARWSSLRGALEDVDEVAAALKKIGFKVILKKDLEDRESFNTVFEEFSLKYGEGERNKDNQLLFYYAGHGYTKKMATNEELGYLVMINAPDPKQDPLGFKRSSIDMVSIVTQAKLMKAKHVLFMFDSCFSGTILNLRCDVTPEHISDNVRYPVRQFITAGRANEKVPDYSRFKQAFLDLLEGRGKEPILDGYITGEELGLYLKQKVPRYNPQQHPQYGKINDPKLDKGDFVFLSKRGYEPPRKLTGIDFSELEIEAKWSKWQKIFENDVDKAKEIEKNSDISASSKKSTWEKVLNTYSQNNPYSDKDEQLRDYAKKRIRYWKKICEDKSGDHAPPADVKIVESKGWRVYKNDKDFWEADNGDDIKMVYIPEGEFKMGSNDKEDEKPIHLVNLDGYWMGKYEVTIKQYMKFVNATKTHYPQWLEQGSKFNINTGDDDFYKKFVSNENHPIVGISWNDAKAYCDWLSTEKNLTFKLPTEAQWEKAARGTDGRKYPWGNIIPDETLANFGSKIVKTSPVGSYSKGSSPYGLLDMAGNVWEWCSDWYKFDYYNNSPKRNPTGPKSDTFRVVRGGSWFSDAAIFRCAYRYNGYPSKRCSNLGFRLCQENK